MVIGHGDRPGGLSAELSLPSCRVVGAAVTITVPSAVSNAVSMVETAGSEFTEIHLGVDHPAFQFAILVPKE